MAEYTYEEETRKRPDPLKTQEYAYSSPVGTYYGEAGNPQSDAYAIARQRLSEAADPTRHAEQDAKIQRSRNFWTGANLFANVMANAINVNGTANNAPNMTWNDAASQKMYDTWRDADRELRAERRAAAQRLDALDMQDAQMRAVGARNRAAEGKNVYDINYRNAVADARAAYDRDEADWQREQKKQDELDKEARDLKNYEEKRKLDLRYTRRSGGGGGSSKAPKSYDFPVGRSDGRVVRAGNTFEQQLAMAQIADELKRVMNDGKELGDDGWASYEDGKEYNFIARNFDRIYDSNPDFKDWFDSNFGAADDAAYGSGEDEEAADAAVQTAVAPASAGAAQDSTLTNIPRSVGYGTASVAGRPSGNGGGYFIGSKANTKNWIPNVTYTVRNGEGYDESERAVEGGGNAFLSRNQVDENGRFIGTERPPHKLTKKEKKAIKDNGEKPKISY